VTSNGSLRKGPVAELPSPAQNNPHETRTTLVNAGSRQGKEKKDTITPALKAAGLDLIVPSESNPAPL